MASAEQEVKQMVNGIKQMEHENETLRERSQEYADKIRGFLENGDQKKAAKNLIEDLETAHDDLVEAFSPILVSANLLRQGDKQAQKEVFDATMMLLTATNGMRDALKSTLSD